MAEFEDMMISAIDHERAKIAAYTAVANWSHYWTPQEVKRGYEMDGEGYSHTEIAKYLHLRDENNVPFFLRRVQSYIDKYSN